MTPLQPIQEPPAKSPATAGAGGTRRWRPTAFAPLGLAIAIAAAIGCVAVEMLAARGHIVRAGLFACAWALAAVFLAARLVPASVRAATASACLLFWFVSSPIGSFLVRLPWEKALITYDRLAFAIVAAIALAGIVEAGKETFAHSRMLALTTFEILSIALFAIAALSAVTQSNHRGSAVRLTVDSLGVPLLAFHFAKQYLRSPAAWRYLLTAGIALAFLFVTTGAYELATGINALPLPGSSIIREGELRVDGPYVSDSSFAIISLLLAVFLWCARGVFAPRFDRSAGIVYRLAIVAAGAAALLPFFRAVAIALVACAAFLAFADRRSAARSAAIKQSGSPLGTHRSGVLPVRTGARIVAAASGGLILFGLAIFLIGPPSLKQRLTSPRDAYGRLLSWQFGANLVAAHPIRGVGLGNYPDYFATEHGVARNSTELRLNTVAADTPHSSILWVASELGLPAAAIFLLASLLLLRRGFKALARAKHPRARRAGACLLTLMAAYWIPGLVLSTAMYSDLNLFFFFLLGMLYPLLDDEFWFAAEADRAQHT